MSALQIPKQKLTEAEYLAIEEAAEFKSEFYDGVMYPLHWDGITAMAGANPFHNRIKENLVGELFVRFGDGPCQTYSSDQRVRLNETGMYAYPDIVIICEPPQFLASNKNTLANAQVVIEVVSPSNEGYERGFKFAQYRLQPTIREIVYVSQDQFRIERFVRQPDCTWVLTTFDDPNGDFVLGTVTARIPLARVYRGVEMKNPATGPTA